MPARLDGQNEGKTGNLFLVCQSQAGISQINPESDLLAILQEHGKHLLEHQTTNRQRIECSNK